MTNSNLTYLPILGAFLLEIVDRESHVQILTLYSNIGIDTMVALDLGICYFLLCPHLLAFFYIMTNNFHTLKLEYEHKYTK